jgi:hypothetical protein
MASANSRCAAGSTGRCLTFVPAGYWPRKLPPFQFLAGRTGRGENPPPQLGQTLLSTLSTHVRQNVHSNEQIIAWVESGGKAALQCSQLGRSSSMEDSL